MSYDITIIGAGPCGSALAKRLAAKYKVLLLECRDLTRPWEPGMPTKACGGLFSENAQRSIARMGYAVPREVLADPQLFAVRAIDLETKAEGLYPRRYVNVDREKFDRWLAAMIPGSVDVRYGARYERFEPESGTLSYRQNGIAFTVKTRWLIGADGGNSTVRSQWRPFAPESRYIAVQEWYEDVDHLPYFGAFFDTAVTDYYGWTIPKDGEVVFGVALKPGKDAEAKFQSMKTKLADVGFKFGKRTRREGALIVRPQRFRDVFCGEGKVFLAGEAAGFISPSSSEGYSYAFDSARILADHLLSGTEPSPAGYANECWRIQLKLFKSRLRSPLMFTPWLRNPIMRSGLNAVKPDRENG